MQQKNVYVSVPNDGLFIGEYTYIDLDGVERTDVHVVVQLKNTAGEKIDVIVKYKEAEELAALVEIAKHYYDTIFPDGRELDLDLSPDEFAVRYQADERTV